MQKDPFLRQTGRVYHFLRDFSPIPMVFGNVQLHQIGDICCEIGYEVDEHRQWCYEITLITAGEGTIFTNGIPHPVHANDVYINGKDDLHMIRADRDSQLRYMALGFDFVPDARDTSSLSPNHAQVLKFFDDNHHRCTRDRSGIGDLIARIVQEFYWDRPCFEEVVAASLQLVVHLAYRNAIINSASPKQRDVSSGNVGAAVYRIIRYVEDHIFEIGTIRELAETLGYSYTYVSHLFKDKTGITLQQFIHRKKMERAVELLIDAHLTPTQTAEHLGYQSVRAFSKVFHNIHNMSPAQYSRLHRQEEAT